MRSFTGLALAAAIALACTDATERAPSPTSTPTTAVPEAASSAPPTSTVAATPEPAPLDVGGRIVFLCDEGTCVSAPDGTGREVLVDGSMRLVAWSPDFSMIAYYESYREQRWLVVAEADGSDARRLVEARDHHDPAPPEWSPDGRTIFTEHGPAMVPGRDGLGLPLSILAVDVATGASRVVVDEDTGGSTPAVSPDGRMLAFTSSRDSNGDVFVVPTEGGEPVKLTGERWAQVGPVWLSNERILYWGQLQAGDLFAMDADGSDIVNLSDHPANDFAFPVGPFRASVSPDGELVAFLSDRDGEVALYLVSTDGSGMPRRIADLPAEWFPLPVWSPDGAHLAYGRNFLPDGGVRVVRLSDLATFEIADGGTPLAWLPE